MFGRRKDGVFLKLQRLLEPFGITKFSTDGWGAYERHLDAEQHQVGKEHTQITGCKFSVAQMLCSSAQREGNRIRRERCAEKNAWDSEQA